MTSRQATSLSTPVRVIDPCGKTSTFRMSFHDGAQTVAADLDLETMLVMGGPGVSSRGELELNNPMSGTIQMRPEAVVATSDLGWPWKEGGR